AVRPTRATSLSPDNHCWKSRASADLRSRWIPETLASALRIGSTLGCRVDALRFNGVIRELSSAADPATRTVSAKIAVPTDAAVRSGQFARVAIPGATQRTLLIPAESVSLIGQMERVFIAGEGNRAVLRIVRTGARRGDAIEVLAGLDAGDRVILSPTATLREGQPLEVQP
ncbi:MAG: efflux RND transporter periplasmic adaptor subunit, partial [Opitutaceae bacterium]